MPVDPEVRREQLRRSKARQRAGLPPLLPKRAVCGSESAYRRHLRHGEQCQHCLDEHNRRNREADARRRSMR